MAKQERKRGWIVVLNNYSDEEHKSLHSFAQQNCTKWILAKEVGKIEMTPHIQGYLYFKDAKELHALRRWLDNHRIKLIGANGTPRDNFNYCNKDDPDYLHSGFTEKEMLPKEKKEKSHPLINSGPARILPICEDFGYTMEEDDDCGDDCKHYEMKGENEYIWYKFACKCSA